MAMNYHRMTENVQDVAAYGMGVDAALRDGMMMRAPQKASQQWKEELQKPTCWGTLFSAEEVEEIRSLVRDSGTMIDKTEMLRRFNSRRDAESQLTRKQLYRKMNDESKQLNYSREMGKAEFTEEETHTVCVFIQTALAVKPRIPKEDKEFLRKLLNERRKRDLDFGQVEHKLKGERFKANRKRILNVNYDIVQRIREYFWRDVQSPVTDNVGAFGTSNSRQNTTSTSNRRELILENAICGSQSTSGLALPYSSYLSFIPDESLPTSSTGMNVGAAQQGVIMDVDMGQGFDDVTLEDVERFRTVNQNQAEYIAVYGKPTRIHDLGGNQLPANHYYQNGHLFGVQNSKEQGTSSLEDFSELEITVLTVLTSCEYMTSDMITDIVKDFNENRDTIKLTAEQVGQKIRHLLEVHHQALSSERPPWPFSSWQHHSDVKRFIETATKERKRFIPYKVVQKKLQSVSYRNSSPLGSIGYQSSSTQSADNHYESFDFKEHQEKANGQRAAPLVLLPEIARFNVASAWGHYSIEPEPIKCGSFVFHKDLASIQVNTCLTDRVMEAYTFLITSRSRDNPELPKAFVFDWNYLTLLTEEGYLRVRGWSRKMDIFSYEFLFLPIKLDDHWGLVVVDFGKKLFRFYGPEHIENTTALPATMHYISQESKIKKQQEFDFSGWESGVFKIKPKRQRCLCGMFVCHVAERFSRRSALNFLSEDIEYYQKKMVHEIMENELLE